MLQKRVLWMLDLQIKKNIKSKYNTNYKNTIKSIKIMDALYSEL